MPTRGPKLHTTQHCSTLDNNHDNQQPQNNDSKLLALPKAGGLGRETHKKKRQENKAKQSWGGQARQARASLKSRAGRRRQLSFKPASTPLHQLLPSCPLWHDGANSL